MVNQELLNDTLQKINASLNKRFEKDADLYISKQDEYEMKKHLCNEAYAGVVDMAKAKGISHDIIVKVIMRNAGVFNVKTIGMFKKELKPILESANYKVLSYMMEDVLGNNVYMQKKLRHILFSYYVRGITPTARLHYWEGGNFEIDEEERTELFELIIKDDSNTLKFKTDFIEDAFERYPSFLKGDVFVKLKETLDDGEKKEFFKFLCEEMDYPSQDNEVYNFILVDAYASYGEQAFNDAVGKIKAIFPGNFKQYIKVICKLFWKEKDESTLISMFDTISKVYQSPYIKNYVKNEIDRKVWKAAKSNEVLYRERKARIDGLMSTIEQIDKAKYSTFADILIDVSNNARPQSIAYFWVNMKSPNFEKSLLDSFYESGSALSYRWRMETIYSWLFEHSMKRGKIRELTRLCERLAYSLHEFSSTGKSSELYDALDSRWVDNVVKYKLRGSNIKAYLFEKHFDKVKEWE